MSASRINTLAELFLLVADRDQPKCLLYRQESGYMPISAAQLSRRVMALHQALASSGLEKGDRVVLLAENGPHWPLVDFAALTMGAVLTPIYPTLTSEQAAFITADCGARIAFVQGRDRFDELLARRDQLPAVERFVLIGEAGDSQIETLDDLLASAAEPDAAAFRDTVETIAPDDLATFVYTSGTTGRPKGVMLTHGNIASNVHAAVDLMEFRGDYTALSFLPLSHSFERMVDYCYFKQGITIAYAESVHTVSRDLMDVRPHLFVSVPRVYEKVLAKVQEGVARSSPLKQRIFAWATKVADRALPYRLRQETPPGLLGFQTALADKLVFSKIKQRLGGRFEFAVSGGAPLSPEVARFFWGAGICIYEGYGLSETSPVLTVNHPGSVRLGTVGPAIPGVELRFADDGEILARGPNIMLGYHGMPEETAKTIDPDGWFHTGDIGEFDDAWHLKITDRKKAILVNAYGKNIAPAPIENALKASPYIGHVVVIGDRRKFLSALLVPDFDTLGAWCAQHDVATDDWQAVVDNPAVKDLFAAEIARVNEGLSGYQQIKAFDLVGQDFTIEGGELTPTQKIKRRVVLERYGEMIDSLYTEAESRHTSGDQDS